MRTSKSNAPSTKADANKKSSQEEIEKRAYELYEKKGCQSGNELGDWLEAERLIKSGK